MEEIKILQSVAVDARNNAKNIIKVDSLHNVKQMQIKQLTAFQLKCVEYIHNKIITNTSLQPKVVRLIITPDNTSYAVVVGNYIIDPALDYYIPTKTFAMLIKDYPIKLISYQIITDKFNIQSVQNNIPKEEEES
jgi:hypothetical protein